MIMQLYTWCLVASPGKSVGPSVKNKIHNQHSLFHIFLKNLSWQIRSNFKNYIVICQYITQYINCIASLSRFTNPATIYIGRNALVSVICIWCYLFHVQCKKRNKKIFFMVYIRTQGKYTSSTGNIKTFPVRGSTK